MKKLGLGLVCVLLASACGGDDAQASLSQRDADSSECPGGGLVISIDGQEQPPLCSGVDGRNGLPGADGVPGAPGAPGSDGADGTNGANGVNGSNGANGTDALLPELVQETVFCTATTTDPAPFRTISYKHARLYDGALFLTVNCDTLVDQDTQSDMFSVDQVGASTGNMRCALLDETSAVIVIAFAPNFLTRRLQVTEDSAVVVDQGFDADCTVVNQ